LEGKGVQHLRVRVKHWFSRRNFRAGWREGWGWETF